MRGRKPADLTTLKGAAIAPFREAVRSPATLDVYERRLAAFLRWSSLTADGFVERARAEPAWAQDRVTAYMLAQKGRAERKEIAASTLSNFRKPVRLLLEMNDIQGVNWRKIGRLMPQGRRFALDRAPTMEELRLMLDRSDIRAQAIILTMVSSGVRLGAWDTLDWGHVEPVRVGKTLVAAWIRVYAGEPEEYRALATPEAYGKLREYMDYREQCGEGVTARSPLARDKWLAPTRGGPRGEVMDPQRLDSNGVKRLLEDTFWRIGLRRERKRRHEFSIHSFRKWFKTRAEQAMKPINVETLMGHSTGISDSYYRPTERELLDDYLKAAPLLTVSKSAELESELGRAEKKHEEDWTKARLENLELKEEMRSHKEALGPLAERLQALETEVASLRAARAIELAHKHLPQT